MSKLLVWSIAILYVVAAPRGLAQETLSPEEAQAEALSMFQALSANWRALHCYDVTLREEYFGPAEQGQFRETKLLRRMLADHQRGYFFFAQLSSQTLWPAPTDGRASFYQTSGFFFDLEAKQCWFRGPGARFVAIPLDFADRNVAIRKALGLSRFPDPRLIGSLPYPVNFLRNVSLDQHFAREFSQPDQFSIREIGAGHATVVQTIEADNGPNARRIFRFDNTNLMPTQLVRSVHSNDGPFVPYGKETFEWKEHAAIFLPIVLRGERVARSSNGKDNIVRNYDVDLFWDSVNSRKDLLSPSLEDFRDSKSFLKLIHDGIEAAGFGDSSDQQAATPDQKDHEGPKRDRH